MVAVGAAAFVGAPARTKVGHDDVLTCPGQGFIEQHNPRHTNMKSHDPKTPFLLLLLGCGAASAAPAQVISPPPVPVQPQPAVSVSVAPAGQFEMSLDSIADLTGDGRRDFLVGLPGLDQVQIRNGRTGGLVATIAGAANTGFGREVAAIGDVNGDGREDIAVGAVFGGPTGNGQVLVFGYLAGGPVVGLNAWSMTPAQTSGVGADYGWAITRMGDLNGDGVEEIAVGARGFSPIGSAPGYWGLVEVLSPVTVPPTVLNSVVGSAVWEDFGDALASISDLDGDGVRELVVGATRQAWGGTIPGQAPGIARVYSGLNLGFGAPPVVLASMAGTFNFDNFGFAVADAGDIDLDGRSDVLIGTPDVAAFAASSACFYRGATIAAGSGTAQYCVNEPSLPSLDFAWAISSVGDLNGDNRPDFVIGAPDVFGGSGATGNARVINARTGRVLFTLTVPGASMLFGFDVSELGAVGGINRYLVGDPGTGMVHIY